MCSIHHEAKLSGVCFASSDVSSDVKLLHTDLDLQRPPVLHNLLLKTNYIIYMIIHTFNKHNYPKQTCLYFIISVSDTDVSFVLKLIH